MNVLAVMLGFLFEQTARAHWGAQPGEQAEILRLNKLGQFIYTDEVKFSRRVTI
jgi:hypothetical protein